jgi:hypothetical protein
MWLLFTRRGIHWIVYDWQVMVSQISRFESVVIICEAQEKIEFMWTVHIICKKWKTIFQEKFSVFHDEFHYMLRNIFRRCEACLDAGIQHFETSLKWGKLNCRGETDSECLVDEGFMCSSTSVVAAVLRDKENAPQKCPVYLIWKYEVLQILLWYECYITGTTSTMWYQQLWELWAT